MAVPLQHVKKESEISASLASFNQKVSDPELASTRLKLLRETSLWVYDPVSRKFGPSKFVGFAGMDLTKYHSARGGDWKGDRFDGGATHKAIEKVLGQYMRNDSLAAQLRGWANALIDDEDAFRGIETAKWKFISLKDPEGDRSVPPDWEDWEDPFEDPPEGSKHVAGSGQRQWNSRSKDWAKIDAANRELGLEGETFVSNTEQVVLRNAKRPDLADKVVIVSKNGGDGLGYDVVSFGENGSAKYIEVKTTKGEKGCPFYLSSNELEASGRLPEYWLYRVFKRQGAFKIFRVKGPLAEKLSLEPVTYRARMRKRDST